MKKKVLKTFFLNMKEREANRTLSYDNIDNMFRELGKVTLDKKSSNLNRVLELDNSVFYMILGSDDPSIPSFKGCITGLFVKDREYNYPYESNDKCKLTELMLSKKDDKIAEVTYFLIDPNISTMLWISNRYVSGFSKMYQYINTLLDQANSKLPRLDLLTYSRSDAEDRFMHASRVKTFTFKTTGNISELIPRTKSTLERTKEFDQIDSNRVINYVEVKFSFVPGLGDKSTQAQKQIIRDVQEQFNLQKSEASVVVDDQSQDIDFLDDKLVLSQVIEINERYTNFVEIFKHLHDQLVENKQSIIRNYRGN